MLNIARLLQRIGEVSFVIARPENWGYKQEWVDRTKSEFDLKRIVKFIPSTRQRFMYRIRHELDPSFMNLYKVTACESDREYILKLIDEYDMVWIHTVQLANVFRIYRWPNSVLDVDDLPSRFYASAAKADSKIVQRLIYLRKSLLCWRRERLFKKRFDLITVCSENDKKYLGNDNRIHVIPNGFDIPSQVPQHSPVNPPRIGFIGTFEHIPNRKGIEWFVSKVWPLIIAKVPEACLRMVGEGSDRYFPRNGHNIKGLGWLNSTKEEIATWSAMIVPVMAGGGTRIKVAEAFARKCPVVSTSLGVFGYDVCNGEHLLIADNPQDFAEACIHMIDDPALADRISENAWKEFMEKWTWDSFADCVANAVEECLNIKNR